jgi:rhodanese-related sulfurtransferase
LKINDKKINIMSEQQSEPQVVSEAKEKLSEVKEEAKEKINSQPEVVSEAKEKIPEPREADVISEAKEKLSKVIPDIIPTPQGFTPVSSAQALKERLQWGEPGLTIIDARSREAFLEERITGAMLASDVSSLPENREIYIYANTDDEAAEAADNLRQDGFESVSQLQGGLAGWKAINGATEGRTA